VPDPGVLDDWPLVTFAGGASLALARLREALLHLVALLEDAEVVDAVARWEG
jgi:hypothetical protein